MGGQKKKSSGGGSDNNYKKPSADEIVDSVLGTHRVKDAEDKMGTGSESQRFRHLWTGNTANTARTGGAPPAFGNIASSSERKKAQTPLGTPAPANKKAAKIRRTVLG